MHRADSSPQLEEIEDIYRQLIRGNGRERVNDKNVFALIDRAARDGRDVLERELREWLSLRGDAMGDVPGALAPTRGFNREHVKH